MKWIEVEWNQQNIRVPAQKIKGKLWFHLDGETHSVDMVSDRKKGAKAGAAGTGEIKAPMPGKILKVFVGAGDKVEQGQPVVAMEAMKMEYTLEADISGKVESLTVKVGDQVALGDLLAQLKE